MPLSINAQRKSFLSEGEKTKNGTVICDFLLQYFVPNKVDSDDFGSVICDFVIPNILLQIKRTQSFVTFDLLLKCTLVKYSKW